MGREIHKSTCVMDCPDTCALEIEVDAGRIERIGGGRDHPDTAGFICAKIGRFARRVYHRDRLLYPARRVGAKGAGELERISWPEAIAEVSKRLGEVRDRFGGEAILPFHYGGSNGKLSDGLVDAAYFTRLGASRLDKTICAAPTGAVAQAMYGKMPGVAFADYVGARLIVIWGANPRVSNIHLVPYLRRARKAGAKIVLIDPRRTMAEEDVDLHLPVRPGTDLALALAVARRLEENGALDAAFLDQNATNVEGILAAARAWDLHRAAETTGVEAERIDALARLYAESEPAVIRCGWGLERNRNGGQAVAAILALPALAGKFGVRGGGYTLSNGGAYHLDRSRLPLPVASGSRRSVNMTRLGRALTEPLDPPIRALFVYNANPAATVPDQNRVLKGLARPDLFTVVFEQVMTDTARYADVLLPATTFLEAYDLRAGYGSYVVGGAAPVIEAEGEARSNVEVFAALGRAQGYDDEIFTWDQRTAMRRVAAAIERPGDPLVADSLAHGENARYDFPGEGPIQFESVFPRTADGKIDLAPAALGAKPYELEPATEGYPLALISPATSKLISSTLGEFNHDRLMVSVSPPDAAARGLEGGDPVRVFNSRGRVDCWLEVDARLRPGVAAMPKGAWSKSSANGSTATALAPDHVNRVAGGACFNDARVEIARRAE
ncbi:MAG TPA: molybdopterin-dependent oxidoreductase [Thermoanaerobaculia bacterium]|nr:molybdopterin-dependent oxidoreductase [Thermoanaerobaculia bacterium]